MGSEFRVNTVMCLGLAMAVYQNTDKLNIPEVLLLGLSSAVVLCLSFMNCRLKNKTQYRINELGLPCCLLLPLISIASNANSDEKFTYNLFYVGLILISVIPVFSNITDGKRFGLYLGLTATFSFIVALTYWMILLLIKNDMRQSFIILPVLLFFWALQNFTPQHLSKCFTFGELATLGQALSCFLFSFLIGLPSSLWPSFTTSESSIKDLVTFTQVSGISCALFVIIITLSAWFRRDVLRSVILLASVAILFALPLLLRSLSKDPVAWLVHIIFKSKTNIFLVTYWFVCVVAAILLAVGYNSEPNPSIDKRILKRSEKTKVRKLFHLLIVLVYLPGVLLDPLLLHVASVVAMVAMVVVECLRFFSVPPIGEPIRQSFSVFLDDQDGGLVVLTPIYLLIGCSSSLWLSIGRDLPRVVPLLGVMSLGVGDSAASYFGSKYGRHHWKDSPKTIEGTVASIVSQIMFVALLHLAGFNVLGTISFCKFLLAVSLSSLFESFTSQIDNLLLPLFVYLLLC